MNPHYASRSLRTLDTATRVCHTALDHYTSSYAHALVVTNRIEQLRLCQDDGALPPTLTLIPTPALTPTPTPAPTP